MSCAFQTVFKEEVLNYKKAQTVNDVALCGSFPVSK